MKDELSQTQGNCPQLGTEGDGKTRFVFLKFTFSSINNILKNKQESFGIVKGEMKLNGTFLALQGRGHVQISVQAADVFSL